MVVEIASWSSTCHWRVETGPLLASFNHTVPASEKTSIYLGHTALASRESLHRRRESWAGMHFRSRSRDGGRSRQQDAGGLHCHELEE